eukprot:scaffold3637_cov200-Pinguiococcus_pyrenoidosus.AAC.1
MAEKLEKDQHYAQMLEDNGFRSHECYYEDLQVAGFGAVLTFLNVDPDAELSTTYVKRHVTTQREVIKNWDSFAAEVGKSPVFRWHLEGAMPGRPQTYGQRRSLRSDSSAGPDYYAFLATQHSGSS